MVKKRDGPAPFSATPGQRQGVNERALPLPQAKSPRNPQGRPPSQHRKPRHRQPQGWRQFDVRVVTKPGAEGATALYAYLRAAAKRFGLEVASVDEVHDHEKNR